MGNEKHNDELENAALMCETYKRMYDRTLLKLLRVCAVIQRAGEEATKIIGGDDDDETSNDIRGTPRP